MNKTNYVDGFVLVVPKGKKEEYIKMANSGRDAWMKHGALAYFECKGDDLTPKDMGGMSIRPFPEMAGAKEDEDVWFSFITFKSKEHRDEVNAKVYEEMSAQADQNKDFVMPFEMNRMATGGFTVEVSGE
ncbi:MAG: hypothetical protein RIQ54_630 [Candidatus Parcubacteria bacterium]|jgi:uncharacterized protein YbaA (DUF1428 family)